MSHPEYSNLFTRVVPELLVVVTAFVALLVDVSTARRKPLPTRMRTGAGITVVGCMLTIVWLAATTVSGKHVYGDGMLIFGSLPTLMQQLLLALSIFTALLSLHSDFTEHVGEYFALLLIATAGMMFLVATENLLLIFLSLELLSLCLYILTAFNKRNIKSSEAALKYFLFGGASAAFLLFGLSWLYGLSGELALGKMALKLRTLPHDPLLIMALVMVIVGFGFKVAAAPFHLWAPDAYEGAPTPSAAFIASGSKVASFFILAQFLVLGMAGVEGSGAWRNFAQGWVPLLAVVAALSMIVGNLAAIAQSSVRRLLAYSAIAQGGYMLLGIMAEGMRTPDGHGLAALIYYLGTYGLTIVGAFGIVEVVQSQAGSDQFAAFAGLSKRAPLLSFCMLIFMLSLAGIPPLAGFFGKFYLFTSALSNPTGLGMLWLVVLAVAMSAVSLYYYLQVLKQIFVREAAPGVPGVAPALGTQIAIALLAAAVIVLGCAPNLVLDPLIALVQTSLPGY